MEPEFPFVIAIPNSNRFPFGYVIDYRGDYRAMSPPVRPIQFESTVRSMAPRVVP